MSEKNLVLFDVGGVLLELDYDNFYRKAATKAGMTSVEFKRKYQESGLEVQALRGIINRSEYLQGIKELIDSCAALTNTEVESLVASRWKRQIPEILELKRTLAGKGIFVGIFSNIDQLSHEILETKYPCLFSVYNVLSPEVYSYQLGSIKPEDAMYQKITGFNKVTFIDDKESYLNKGIKGYGWNGILYTPSIDKEEAIRAIHNDYSKPSKNFRQADSFEQLLEALAHFGIS